MPERGTPPEPANRVGMHIVFEGVTLPHGYAVHHTHADQVQEWLEKHSPWLFWIMETTDGHEIDGDEDDIPPRAAQERIAVLEQTIAEVSDRLAVIADAGYLSERDRRAVLLAIEWLEASRTPPLLGAPQAEEPPSRQT